MARAGATRPTLVFSAFLAIAVSLCTTNGTVAFSGIQPVSPPARGDVVSVRTKGGVVLEGENAVFRIQRGGRQGELSVGLLVSGDATPEADYRVSGASLFDGARVTLVLADAADSAELTIETVDDVSAEAPETVTLALEPSPYYTIDSDAPAATLTLDRNDVVVTTVADHGQGSLRQAILNANAIAGADAITFDSDVGPFGSPRTIALDTPLPDLESDLTIDGFIADRLWQASGVTISGNRRMRVFTVAPGANVTLANLTVSGGVARDGGGIANYGSLVAKGLTIIDNRARRRGGGIANLGGELTAINSTFANNSARKAGGGLADVRGRSTLNNNTFAGNAAKKGGGLYSNGVLLLRNTVVADSARGVDCMAVGTLESYAGNLIETNAGCGTVVTSEDPGLGALGAYNGPTKTIPLNGGSPAINSGNNAFAVDENGEPLEWDQRGNGDPRFVGGLVDIGSFENQMLPVLTVDTVEDAQRRGCSQVGAGDCSLRGAIMLANATPEPDVIRFDPAVFADPITIVLTRPLPDLVTEITIDGRDAADIRIQGIAGDEVFKVRPGVKTTVLGVTVETDGTLPIAEHPSDLPGR